MHTSGSPTYFDQPLIERLAYNLSLTSVAIPVRIKGRYWRAPRTPKVWELWGPDYPAVLVELEDPNPNLEGEEAIRLTAHGSAFDALGSQDIAWRMWMPGRFKIKVDVQERIVEKPQAELTAGDVVSLLADTVKSKSGGDLTINHRDLHKALIMISKKSNTLERRWALLDERLKFNKNLVNKPEEVAFVFLTMMLVDTNNAKEFVKSVREGEVTGWAAILNKVDSLGQIRVYGSFANLLGEGQRMLPQPQSAEPEGSFRVPASVFLGSYQILRYVNWVLDNDQILGPMIKRIATTTIENQRKALAIGQAILEARGQAFDRIRLRVERATPQLVAQIGERADLMMKQIGEQLADQIDSGNFERPQLQDGQSQAKKQGKTN